MTKMPHFIDWAITKECNLQCTHCTGMMDTELNTDKAMQVIDEIADLNPGWVIVEGGEPLLRKDLFPILYKMQDKALDTYMITNAQLMNNEMADKLKQIGVKVLISIDGADSVIYEEIKKGASWEKMLENAKLSSACGILHGITVVLSKHNLHQIKDFVLLAEELGAKHIIFIPLQPFKSDAYSRLSLTAADYRIAINEVLSLKTEIDISFDEPFFTPFAKKLMPNKLNSGIVVNEFKGCILGDYIYIQTNGDIRPCMFAPTELTIGNVQNEPLSDLWTKMQNHTLLKELKDQSLRKGKCGECQHFDDCGGCPTRIRGTHHNWFESDPACPLI